MTAAEINAQYDEQISEITGDSPQHQATRDMINQWRADALKDAVDAPIRIKLNGRIGGFQ